MNFNPNNSSFKISKMKLPVKMTDEEYIKTAKELNERLSHLESMLNEIAEMRAHHAPNIKMEKKAIHDLNIQMTNSYILKETEVIEIFNFDTRTVYTRRKDTGEIIPSKFREMTDEEYNEQLDLFRKDQEKKPVPNNLLPSPSEIKLIEAEITTKDDPPSDQKSKKGKNST